jgi:hypothetical protein
VCADRCPDLLPENREAWRLWMLAATQWRFQGVMPIGLDYPAVFEIAAVNLIEVTPALFQKLRWLEAYQLTMGIKEAKSRDGYNGR